MFGFRRWLFCAALALGWRMPAAPALTTIQDTLYLADGSPFNGVVTITWQSFEAADSSNIASQAVRLTISNGNLYVQLTPTTTAATPASYAVEYNSSGHTKFTETWVVPPSAAPLRVRDVRLAPGIVVTAGPPPTLTTVQIADVIGLQNALNLRPTMGPGYTVARAAVIDAQGALEGAAGGPSDCVHVDGTAGACGSAGSGSFVDGEVPSGTIDGVNATFTLANAPDPPASLMMFRNGMLLRQSLDYTISDNTIVFQGRNVPHVGDLLVASYRLAVSLPGIGFVDGETPAGIVDGVNGAFTLLQAPNPASSLAVYRNGLRQKSGLDYTATNNTITFGSGTLPQIGDVLVCSYRIAQ